MWRKVWGGTLPVSLTSLTAILKPFLTEATGLSMSSAPASGALLWRAYRFFSGKKYRCAKSLKIAPRPAAVPGVLTALIRVHCSEHLAAPKIVEAPDTRV